MIEMSVVDFVKSMVESTRVLRERAFQGLQENGCNDLAYRPSTGMSAVGWLLAHQAAVYDFVLNMLIRGGPPKSPDFFYSYRGDPSDTGDWIGTPLPEIEAHYGSAENDFLFWIENTSVEELNRELDESCISQYHQGMRIVDVISDMLAHLNHHNGHLNVIKNDWCRLRES
ncbi:MAG: DinB family protein [Candidatus Thorarchaeota archaeon]|nr:MAG: DinB family protein [Candidatus Thorarchaeota archaeon]